MNRPPERPYLRLVTPEQISPPIARHELTEQTRIWLERASIPFSRPTELHFKIGSLNFFPTSGTLHFDAHRRLPVRGLGALRTLLQRTLKRNLPPLP